MILLIDTTYSILVRTPFLAGEILFHPTQSEESGIMIMRMVRIDFDVPTMLRIVVVVDLSWHGKGLLELVSASSSVSLFLSFFFLSKRSVPVAVSFLWLLRLSIVWWLWMMMLLLSYDVVVAVEHHGHW